MSASRISEWLRRNAWVLCLGALALAVRFAWFSLTARQGGAEWYLFRSAGVAISFREDPYQALAGNKIVGDHVDSPPLDFLIFGILEWAWPGVGPSWLRNDSMRGGMALFDAASVVLLGVKWARPFHQRLLACTFLALHPLAFFPTTVHSSDKPVLLFLMICFVLAWEGGRSAGVWVGLLAATKWYGFAFAPMWWLGMRQTGRRTWRPAAVAALLFCGSHLLWFPSNLVAYRLKFDKAQTGPSHGSVLSILDLIGIPTGPWWVIVFVASIATLFCFQRRGRISVVESAVFATAAFILLPPDGYFPRVALFVNLAWLILRATRRVTVVIWVASFLALLPYLGAIAGLPLPWGLGAYASLPYTLATQSVTLCVLGAWILQVRARTRLTVQGADRSAPPSPS